MSLNPVRPLKSASATATQGSKIVTVSGGVNCSFLRSGSIISIGDKHLVDAVSGTVPDGSGNSTITLRDEWPFTTQTARLIAFMSYEGLADAVVRLNQIADAQSGALEGAFSFMGNWSAVAGDFPPVPGDDLGSQMYRISAAGSMGGRAYRVGELIYYDQFTEQWRPLYEGLGTAATRDVTTSSTDTTSTRLLSVGAGHQQLDSSLYRRGNILGTVSQSGGVPTGAIIQRGSNANGEFTLFADGTAFLWRRNTTVDLTTSINTFTLPIAIINTTASLQLSVCGTTVFWSVNDDRFVASQAFARTTGPTSLDIVPGTGYAGATGGFDWFIVARWY